MKKHLSTILTSATILILGVLIFAPQVVVAQAAVVDYFTTGAINGGIAIVANFFLGATAWLLSISGLFLSVSVNMTTHIKDIYTGISGIETVWVTVRDISSMLIIFFLLYTSIMTIVGKGSQSGIKELIVKIFMAGVLINFSLFFVRVAIDASNIVSLQFYNAISPRETSNNLTSAKAYYDGGISDIFMNSLQIPKIYGNTNTLKSGDVFATIGFATVGGIIIMLTTAISFLAAAVAFTARTAILLFCMALSPLYFVGEIFPRVKTEVSNKIRDMFVGQLIFMPVYLFLMYIALKVISDPGFMNIFNPKTIQGANTEALGAVSIGVIVQYAIAILFINAPLVAAIKMGGVGMSWAPGSSDINAVNKWAAGFLGRNTIGAAASKVGNSRFMRELSARSPYIGGRVIGGALSKVGGASFGGDKGGYDAKIKADKKAFEEMNKKIGTVERSKYKTKEDFDDAKSEAKGYQSIYRNKLSGRSLMNLMLRSRAGTETSQKLSDDANKEVAKKNKKRNENEMAENQKRINEIEAKLKNPTTGVGFGQKNLSQTEIDALNNELSKKKARNGELAEEISLADKANEEDILKKIKDRVKDDGAGEEKDNKKDGGDKKDDK